MVLGFQRAKSGLYVPSPGGLPGFQRQGMDQRKKNTFHSHPLFGAGSPEPSYALLAPGKFAVPAQDGVANAYVILSSPIKSGSGAWYWEAKVLGSGNYLLWGVARTPPWTATTYGGYPSRNYGWYNTSPSLWAEPPATAGTLNGAGTKLAANDIMGFLYDSNARTLAFYKNGALATSAPTSGIAAVDLFPLFAFQVGGIAGAEIHLGAENCVYPAPPGAKYYI